MQIVRSSHSVLSLHIPEKTDWAALASAVINLLLGVAVAFIVGGKLTIMVAFGAVAVQMFLQLFFVPFVLGFVEWDTLFET